MGNVGSREVRGELGEDGSGLDVATEEDGYDGDADDIDDDEDGRKETD